MKQKKKRRGASRNSPRCPCCGSHAVLRSADGIYMKNPRESMLYVCKNYPDCDAYVRVHPGTTLPMGTLVNKQLRTLRMEAHRYFDQIYIRGIMSKPDAYHWLSDVLCLPFLQTHIGQMGEYYCNKVIEESKSCWISIRSFLKKVCRPIERRERIAMKLTPEQQHVVENNMGLVGKVIKDKVHGIDQLGCFTYDDLFQIGCIGLCKAAATDKGGCFSTYAYRVIWNEICDVLIQATRLSSREQLLVHSDYRDELSMAVLDQLKSSEVRALLSQTIAAAPERIANGIRCLLLAEEGYSSKELGQMFCAEPATVRMWMTKARRYLQEQPELADYWKES